MRRFLWPVMICLALLMLLAPLGRATDSAAAQGDTAVPNLVMRPDCKLSNNERHNFLIPDTETLGETIDCGSLLTYEVPNDATSNVIMNPFVILKARSDSPQPDPIIYFAGGPGASGILEITDWLESPMRMARDIILYDQRGTGYAYPAVNCNVYQAGNLAECIDQMEQRGADLGNYNTGTSAADVGTLMGLLQSELGYTAFNLYGISYGTRLSLAVMRDYDDALRSVVLDSSFPPNADRMEFGINAQRAFDTLFAYCAHDPICDERYPNLESVFYQTVRNLNRDPLYFGAAGYDGLNFIDELYIEFYSTNALPALPAIIYMASEGRFEDAFALVDSGPPNQPAGYDFDAYYDAYDFDTYHDYLTDFGMLNFADQIFELLMCQEVHYYADFNAAVELTYDSVINDIIAEYGLMDIQREASACNTWTFAAAPERDLQPVFSDVPTLILAGDFDPITPPSWGKLASETLSNSYYLVFPGVGHAVIDTSDCANGVILDFLAAPDSAPDASCRAELGIDFYVE